MSKYAVIIEKGKKGYGAYVPDLPGCVAAGKTLKEIHVLIGDAIDLHVAALREDKQPLPKPSTDVFYYEPEPFNAVAEVGRLLGRAVKSAAQTGVRGSLSTTAAVRRITKRSRS